MILSTRVAAFCMSDVVAVDLSQIPASAMGWLGPLGEVCVACSDGGFLHFAFCFLFVVCLVLFLL